MDGTILKDNRKNNTYIASIYSVFLWIPPVLYPEIKATAADIFKAENSVVFVSG